LVPFFADPAGGIGGASYLALVEVREWWLQPCLWNISAPCYRDWIVGSGWAGVGLDLFSSEVSRQRWLGRVVAAGSLGIAGLSLAFAYPVASPRLLWGGALRLDEVGFVFRMLFLAGVGLTALFAMQVKDLAAKESFLLFFFSVPWVQPNGLGSRYGDAFSAIETASIPLYVLAGFYLRDIRSAEAGLKYVLLGCGICNAPVWFEPALRHGRNDPLV